MPARIRHSPLAAANLAELPVLPFLAPRCLQPWPRNIRRGSSNAASNHAESSAETRRTGSKARWAANADVGSGSSRCSESGRLAHQSFRHFKTNKGSMRVGRACYGTATAGLSTNSQHCADDLDPYSQRGQAAKPEYERVLVSKEFNESGSRPSPENVNYIAHTVSSQAQSPDVARSPSAKAVWCPEEMTALKELPPLYEAWEFVQAERSSKGVGKSSYFGKIWDDWFKWRLRSESQFRNRDPAHYKKRRGQMRYLVKASRSMDVNSLRYIFEQSSPQNRRTSWPLCALHVLAKSPSDGLKFVTATLSEPLPDRKQVSDVLDYIVHHHLGPSSSAMALDDLALFIEAFIELLQKFTQSQVSISDYAVYKLFEHANREEAERLHGALKTRGKRLHINARLFAVERLSKLGATDSAVEVVRTLRRDGVKFNRSDVESVCATLLRCSQRDTNAKLSESDISALLFEFGFVPKVNHYNILARNSIDSGDHDTAWKVYDMLVANGIEPSHHTYSILLNDAKWRLDTEALQRLVTVIREKDIRNERIANDMLHAMWMFHEKKTALLSPAQKHQADEALWHRLLAIYTTYFKLGPLEDLAPSFFKVKNKGSLEEGKKIHPDYPTLTLMICAALKLRVKEFGLAGFYERYRQVLKAGHPDIVKVTKHSFISEAFIMRMGESESTLPHCMTVLADMMGTQAAAAVLKSDTTTTEPPAPVEKQPSHRQPSVHTWTILLRAFMKQSQPRAAEKVLSMMQSQGLEPSEVTWNHLVFGYARMRDEEGLVSAIVRSERAGWEVKPETWRSFGGAGIQAGVMGQVIELLNQKDGEEGMSTERKENTGRWKRDEFKLKVTEPKVEGESTVEAPATT